MGVNVARLSEPTAIMLLYFELSYEAVMSSTNSQSGDGAPHRFSADTPISEGECMCRWIDLFILAPPITSRLLNVAQDGLGV